MTGTAMILGVGAERGLGAALARRFAAGGLHAIVVGRTQDKLDEVGATIEAKGGSAETRIADVRDRESVEAAFAGLGENGPLEAVLYNAGNNAIIPFEDLDAETFESFWRICCLGGFHVAKAAMPILEAQGHGSLLFTGASASLRGKPQFAHFAAAKAGLRMLAQSLARDYGPKGVHVAHVIVDGVIDGDVVRKRFGDYLDRLGPDGCLDPDAIAETFWSVHSQDRSAWTHECEVRPFGETW